jgi:hypothetical protein
VTGVQTCALPISNFSFIQQQTISIYNGVGTYNYVLYRSTYRLQRPTKLKIS